MVVEPRIPCLQAWGVSTTGSINNIDLTGNIKPNKEKSTEKIDGIVAKIMALDRAIRCGLDSGESVYGDRGFLRI